MTFTKRSLLTLVVVGLGAAIAGQKGCELPPIINVPPIDAEGLHVLIVEETGERNLLSAGQLAILTSTQLRKQVADAGGEMLITDVSSDMSLLAEKWTKAMQRERGDLPWTIVSGAGGFEGPLPGTPEEMSELIKKHTPGAE